MIGPIFPVILFVSFDRGDIVASTKKYFLTNDIEV